MWSRHVLLYDFGECNALLCTDMILVFFQISTREKEWYIFLDFHTNRLWARTPSSTHQEPAPEPLQNLLHPPPPPPGLSLSLGMRGTCLFLRVGPSAKVRQYLLDMASGQKVPTQAPDPVLARLDMPGRQIPDVTAPNPHPRASATVTASEIPSGLAVENHERLSACLPHAWLGIRDIFCRNPFEETFELNWNWWEFSACQLRNTSN